MQFFGTYTALFCSYHVLRVRRAACLGSRQLASTDIRLVLLDPAVGSNSLLYHVQEEVIILSVLSYLEEIPCRSTHRRKQIVASDIMMLPNNLIDVVVRIVENEKDVAVLHDHCGCEFPCTFDDWQQYASQLPPDCLSLAATYCSSHMFCVNILLKIYSWSISSEYSSTHRLGQHLEWNGGSQELGQ
jgi:hypothetical protein